MSITDAKSLAVVEWIEYARTHAEINDPDRAKRPTLTATDIAEMGSRSGGKRT